MVPPTVVEDKPSEFPCTPTQHMHIHFSVTSTYTIIMVYLVSVG